MFDADKRSHRCTNTFFLFLGISGGGLAIVFGSWNFMICPILNNFSHREWNLKSSCPLPPPLKIIFFYLLMNLFWERPMSPRTLAWKFYILHLKNLFKATRKNGRSNTDFYNIFFYQTFNHFELLVLLKIMTPPRFVINGNRIFPIEAFHSEFTELDLGRYREASGIEKIFSKPLKKQTTLRLNLSYHILTRQMASEVLIFWILSGKKKALKL